MIVSTIIRGKRVNVEVRVSAGKVEFVRIVR